MAVSKAREAREGSSDPADGAPPATEGHREAAGGYQGGRLGAVIARAIGTSVRRTPSGVITSGSVPREEIPYRLPDALENKEEEQRYYRFLDSIEATHKRNRRVEM
jgi:hypothetical protein